MKSKFTFRIKMLLSAALFTCAAQAQDFKAPIHLIVPFPAGGATDVLARMLAPKIGSSLGQTMIVENRAGAGGQIGTQVAQQAKPDGTTFLMGADQSMVVVPLITPNVPYEATRDFVAVGMIAKFRFAFSTSPATGAKTLAEFGDYVRTSTSRANFGVPAVGGLPQMIGNGVGKKVGVSLVAAPYNGAAPLLSDLMGGQISGGVTGLTEALTLQRGGKVKILAVSGDKRSSLVPDVPTLAEAGAPDLDVTNWFGIFAPKGLPEPMQKRFNGALNDALNDPEVKQKLQELAMEVFPTTLDQARTELVKSSGYWLKVANTPGSGLKP